MNLQLFYRNQSDRDLELESYIIQLGLKFEGYYLDDHRKEYDHNNDSLHPRHHGGSCFCELPDYSDPVWPKLYNGYQYVASGVAAIRGINFSNLK